jgi:hypothetical protein
MKGKWKYAICACYWTESKMKPVLFWKQQYVLRLYRLYQSAGAGVCTISTHRHSALPVSQLTGICLRFCLLGTLSIRNESVRGRSHFCPSTCFISEWNGFRRNMMIPIVQFVKLLDARRTTSTSAGRSFTCCMHRHMFGRVEGGKEF